MTGTEGELELLRRLASHLRLLSSLDLREAEEEVKLLPKFVTCTECGRATRSCDIGARVKFHPYCRTCVAEVGQAAAQSHVARWLRGAQQDQN